MIPIGVPLKGCSPSVVAMLIEGWSWPEHVAVSGAGEGICEPQVYPDNFECMAESADQVGRAVEANMQRAAWFKVDLSKTKSWWWSTGGDKPADLQTCGAARKCHAREFGADVAYGGRRAAQVQQGRCVQFERTCWRIHILPISLECKVAALSIKVLPGLTFGVEATGFSQTRLRALRESAVRSLMRTKWRFGAPELIWGLVSNLKCDPEYECSVRTATVLPYSAYGWVLGDHGRHH
jgi:hypothetical protein